MMYTNIEAIIIVYDVYIDAIIIVYDVYKHRCHNYCV